jgi:hypothetical protein
VSAGPGYLAGMLRLWQVVDDETPCWRASLEDPHTGERRVFASPEALFAHLTAEMADAARPAASRPVSQGGSVSGESS